MDLPLEKVSKITSALTNRQQRKLAVILELKRTSEGIMDNPNETFVNLTNSRLANLVSYYDRPNIKFEIMTVAEDV